MTQRDQQRDEQGVVRETWVKPDVSQIRAGEAELGANAVILEGTFGSGS